MNYRFHPEALKEYSEATQYYARISRSLAADFILEVESGINRILLHPKAWQPIEEDVRRCLIRRFPFGIYYTMEENDSMVIQAILHLSRKPDYWKNRMMKR